MITKKQHTRVGFLILLASRSAWFAHFFRQSPKRWALLISVYFFLVLISVFGYSKTHQWHSLVRIIIDEWEVNEPIVGTAFLGLILTASSWDFYGRIGVVRRKWGAYGPVKLLFFGFVDWEEMIGDLFWDLDGNKF